MKRIISLIIAVITIAGSAFAERTVFIYRNDGTYNSFLDSEIKDMEYSNVDSSGTKHNNYLYQIICTANDTMRIPYRQSTACVCPPAIKITLIRRRSKQSSHSFRLCPWALSARKKAWESGLWSTNWQHHDFFRQESSTSSKDGGTIWLLDLSKDQILLQSFWPSIVSIIMATLNHLSQMIIHKAGTASDLDKSNVGRQMWREYRRLSQ